MGILRGDGYFKSSILTPNCALNRKGFKKKNYYIIIIHNYKSYEEEGKYS